MLSMQVEKCTTRSRVLSRFIHRLDAVFIALTLAACSFTVAHASEPVTPSCATPAELIGTFDAHVPGYIVRYREGVPVSLETSQLIIVYKFQAKSFRHEPSGGFRAELTPQLVATLRCISSVASIEYASVGNTEVPLKKQPKPSTGEGTVMLKLRVGIDGKVIEAQVLKSSGYDKLDEAALQHSKGWKLIPATRNGKPIESWVRVPVAFEITNAKPSEPSVPPEP